MVTFIAITHNSGNSIQQAFNSGVAQAISECPYATFRKVPYTCAPDLTKKLLVVWIS